VGIKKAIGAHRRTLIFQYLGESMLMSFLSLFMAIILVKLLLPKLVKLQENSFAFHFGRIPFLAALGMASSQALSPAATLPYTFGFNPALVLKGKLNTSLVKYGQKKDWSYFNYAVGWVYCIGPDYLQTDRIHSTKNLGYDKTIKSTIVIFRNRWRIQIMLRRSFRK